MDITEALTERANRASGLTAIFAGNIHWVARPQGQALPALVLQVISDPQEKDLDGDAGIMRTARVQADSLAASYADARDGADAAIAALLPEAQVDGDGGSVVFWEGSADGPRDLGEQTDTGFIHRASVDLMIRYAKIS